MPSSFMISDERGQVAEEGGGTDGSVEGGAIAGVARGAGVVARGGKYWAN